MRVEFFGQTDVGRVRSVNEDGFLCLDLSAASTVVPAASSLLAVADGLGGHAGGAIASAMAVKILHDEFQAVDGNDPRAFLKAVFLKANRAIFDRSAREPAHAGMGTTLAAALIWGTNALIANVGDSRLYLFRGDVLSQVTMDHSWAAEQRRRGLLGEREIRKSPFRAMITRSLGYTENVDVDTFEIGIAESDVLLLCTDGLHGILPEKRIMKILKEIQDPKSAGEALVAAAKDAGGDDNITVIIAAFR
ncbi:MAG: Stp1/IreP family PP2C-type Ser/Thr phosphatase [Candidatus Aminicenantales bacterium]